ncbi:MAG: TonB-dependent receptor [Porticoccaceae bacterium]
MLYTYNTGFKAPSFNQLYFPGFGNPDIQAENSRSNELTFKEAWDNLDVG